MGLPLDVFAYDRVRKVCFDDGRVDLPVAAAKTAAHLVGEVEFLPIEDAGVEALLCVLDAFEGFDRSLVVRLACVAGHAALAEDVGDVKLGGDLVEEDLSKQFFMLEIVLCTKCIVGFFQTGVPVRQGSSDASTHDALAVHLMEQDARGKLEHVLFDDLHLTFVLSRTTSSPDLIAVRSALRALVSVLYTPLKYGTYDPLPMYLRP